ncbi:hypothetical protein HDU67_009177 [Dinochytrium kinnereticum]|nr:hypothetical protein HDU67_009177 [Dinochytrium kinnereticum]
MQGSRQPGISPRSARGTMPAQSGGNSNDQDDVIVVDGFRRSPGHKLNDSGVAKSDSPTEIFSKRSPMEATSRMIQECGDIKATLKQKIAEMKELTELQKVNNESVKVSCQQVGEMSLEILLSCNNS